MANFSKANLFDEIKRSYAHNLIMGTLPFEIHLFLICSVSLVLLATVVQMWIVIAFVIGFIKLNCQEFRV